MNGNAKFKAGEKVRIKDRKERAFPTGYPLAGAEGVVMNAFSPWHLFYLDFGGYVPVKIEKCDTKLGLDDMFLFREEDIELI